MQFRDLEQHREWVLRALAGIEHFMRHDPDFRGNLKHELRAIGDQRRFIEDGKYRVVFLGTFNVGKSTAVNAFLGGAYLPMDVEECTSRLTFIERGEQQSLRIELNAPVSTNELDAMQRLLASRRARIEADPAGEVLRIDFEQDSPEDMCAVLQPLITVSADEEYPLLAPLREKIEELNLTLPSSVLQEDIAFVDTPGVHSVSETRAEITYGIIERSHLVISFVDSSFAGNVHDLNFIKRIIKWRGRRVFFVLNKADKLESNEIDVRGARGPARSLIEAFARHDIPEDSEIFFLSGYRALRAQQLEKGQISLEEVIEDNKLSLPSSVTERLGPGEEGVRDLAAYLLGQSRFAQLKSRLVDYLVNENKAGAVVETAAQFIAQRAADTAAPLQNELELARDPSKFDALRASRDVLTQRLEFIRTQANDVLTRFMAKARGGAHGNHSFPGYETQFRNAVSEEAIEEQVVAPTLAWLREGNHLKEARRSKFRNLSAQLEAAVDEFISALTRELNQRMDRDEQEARDAIEHHLGQVRSLRTKLTRLGTLEPATLEASMAQSYAAFGAGGALVGVAAGAAVGSIVPVVGTAIGAGLGGLLGVVGGLLARLAWSEESWLKRLEPVVRENALNMLLHGGKDPQGAPAPAIVEVVAKYIRERSTAFEEAVRAEVDAAIGAVQKEYDDLVAREEEIRRESEAIIARLEPKVESLEALRKQAGVTIEELRGRETLRV